MSARAGALDAARGCLFGLVLGALCWTLILVAVL